jgi:D-alanyl-D-alanine carboxypeptidase (penicillin-binding protein 5/6)
MNYHEILKAVVFCFILILFFCFFWFFTQIFSNNLEEFFLWKETKNQNAFLASIQNNILEISKPIRNWQIEDLKIDADGVISVETDLLTQEKVLFKKNEEKKLPIASLTKLMTALVVLKNYDLSQNVTIEKQVMTQEGKEGELKAGQILSVKELLYIMLIESSNRAAFALSGIMGQDKFIGLMNIEAKNIGLTNTHFTDSSGMDPGSYSTAKDLTILIEHLLKNYPLVGEIIGLKEFDLYLDDGQFHHKLLNTNKLLGEVPGVIGGKTGFTNDAKEII